MPMSNVMTQESFYHPRALAHLDQLLTEIPSSALLDASREVDASPISYSASINHFLRFQGNKILDSISNI